jgi:uridylate kinase
MATTDDLPISSSNPIYKRVLLKLSGEALMGDQSFGVDPSVVLRIASEISQVVQSGVQVSLVVGGGNIFRGISGEAQGIDRVTSDYMGMLATMINALALQSGLEKLGVSTRVQSALAINNICEPYVWRRAKRHLEKGRVVIFAAGSGHPYFTTDSAAVLRASEMGCELLLKGTKVDGIYTADPVKNPDAKRYDRIGYSEVLSKQLNVMDMTAIALARDTHLPIAVFAITQPGSFVDIINGKGHYTLVEELE